MVDTNLYDAYYLPVENVPTKYIQGLREAYSAARMSDHTTQVGAVVGAAYGYNKAFDDQSPDVRIHAETSSIIKNAKMGVGLENHTMYAPWAACGDCAMAIVEAGICRVVVHHQRMQLTPPKWQGCVDHGLHILTIHGVKILGVDMHLGEQCRIDGEEVIL